VTPSPPSERSLAMVLPAAGAALEAKMRPVPRPGPGEMLIRVHACGVCRTDLHIVDGDLAVDRPIVPGHEIVGVVVGPDGAGGFAPGERVGVPWLGGTCGRCPYCVTQRENLCDAPEFTGWTRDGGYAEHVIARTEFCFRLPAAFDDFHAAPLLCAGLIGYRALRMAGDARSLGLYGFGAAAHLIAQVAVAQGRKVHAFTRPGDVEGQAFARSLGCHWAGDSTAPPPQPLDAAILFAPVGALVPAALGATRKGAVIVCAGIYMSDIPSFPYRLLWGERVVRSVANLTRADGEEFLELAARIPLQTRVQVFPLREANAAIAAVRAGRVQGAAVLDCRQAA
jgi:propanol-preferring alcohol dehydrogenase